MVIKDRQNFKQNTWFLESNRVLPKSLYGILHCLISITKLQKSQSIKPNFILITRATLSEYLYTIFEAFETLDCESSTC